MTAFCTAGVLPMVLASPMPFAPSGFSGVGVSVLCTSKHASSLVAPSRAQRAREPDEKTRGRRSTSTSLPVSKTA